MLPRKPLQTDLNASHALSSFKLRSSSKSVPFNTSRIWGPIKIPSLSLAALRPGNIVDKCWKEAPFLCNAFMKFFIKPSLMWRGRRSTLFMSTRGFSLRLCSPRTKVLLDPHLSACNAGIQLDYPRDRENNSTVWSPLAYP